MARIRTVKPEYPKHRKTRLVSREARLLNIHLWNLADDEGRLQELENWIIGEVFPTDTDVTPGVLHEWLLELSNAGLIHRYTVKGEKYIQCHDFNDHQVISKPQPSTLPSLEQADSEPLQNDSRNGTGTVPALAPDESKWEGNGMEGKEEGKREGKKEGNGRESSSPAVSPPTKDEAPLSFLLAALVAENDPNGKRPNVTKRWADAERLMIEKDGRDREQAERLLRWTAADSFWGPNVQSMPKFRQRYGQLHRRMVAARTGGGGRSDDRMQQGMDRARQLAERARQLREREASSD